jgi:hypothetical protein
MTSSDQSPATHAFVTFRVAGNALDPADVTKILHIAPTHAHRMGETYRSGPIKGRPITGKSGVWYFSTDRLVESAELDDHLAYVRKFLHAGSRRLLHDLLGKQHLTAALTCFWHGQPHAKPPIVPGDVRELLGSLPATIETDFATDDQA